MRRPPDVHLSPAVDPADRGRTFTLELRRPCGPALSGRLTRAVTGETVHFASADELVALLCAYSRGGGPTGA